ncbi:hypothetical protein ABH932_007285 [Streptacidiphilus sp. MAP5-52]
MTSDVPAGPRVRQLLDGAAAGLVLALRGLPRF